MQINFNSSRVASAALRGLGRSESSPLPKAKRTNRSYGDDADNLHALALATGLAWRIENAVWLALAAAAAAVLLLSFSLAG